LCYGAKITETLQRHQTLVDARRNGDFHFISEIHLFATRTVLYGRIGARFRNAQTVGPNKATTNLGAHVLKSNFFGSFGHFSCITVHRYAVIQDDEELKQRRSFNMRVWNGSSLVPVISGWPAPVCSNWIFCIISDADFV